MNKQVATIGGAAILVILIAGGVAIAVGGGGDDEASVTSETATTTTSTTIQPVQDGGQPSGGGAEEPSGGGSSNIPPEIRDLQPFAEFGGDDCDMKPFLDLQGHAFDEDGSNDQQVQSVEINWGDGNSTTITTFANGAFVGSLHCYDSSYVGQTVNVHVKAVDEDGATDEEDVSVPLPAQ
jgi:hypothetical protein